MTNDPQLKLYAKLPPGAYAVVHDKVALCMRLLYKGCISHGGETKDCDLDDPCWRHSRTTETVERYFRRFK